MNSKRGVSVVLGLALVAMTSAAYAFSGFDIYTEKKAKENHYAPSGWMGDFKSIRFSDGWPKNAHSGSTCIKITYDPTKQSAQGWAGIYWQEPANNWGNQPGFDVTGATKLTFWIRGEKGGEVISDIFVGGIDGVYPDTASVAVGPIDLSTEWEKFEINLEGQDLSSIAGGFGWSTSASENPDGVVFYLDDIRFE